MGTEAAPKAGLVNAQVTDTKRELSASGSLFRKSACWSDGGLHIYKTEIDSETWKANLWFLKGKGGRDKLGVWD